MSPTLDKAAKEPEAAAVGPEVVPSVPPGMEFPERNDAPLTTGDLAWQREVHDLYWPNGGSQARAGDTSGLSDMTAYSALPEVVSQWQRFKGYGMASTVFNGDGLLLVDGVKFIYRVEGDHIIAMSAPSRPTEEK